MDEENKIEARPEPEKSGTKEVQEKPTEIITPEEIEGIPGGGLNQYPLSTAVKGITDLGIKGNAAMALLYVAVSSIEKDRLEERTEKKRVANECNDWKERYFGEREQNSVLKERLRGANKIKILQSIFLTLGGLLTGVGIKGLIQEYSGTATILTIIGSVLLLAGWFWPNSFSKEIKS